MNLFTSSFGRIGRSKTLTPHLEHRAAFARALKNYTPDAQTIATLAKTPLVVLVAPTASGRNTIIDALVKTDRYQFLISDTTRPPRQNNGVWEQNGREYFFRSEPEMLAEIKAGKFVEAEIIHAQQVSGTSVREIERAYKDGKIAVGDVDIEGGIHLAHLKPDTCLICVIPPSFNAWLARIKGREAIEPVNLHRRMQTATKLLARALADPNFVFVVNDKLEDAISEVNKLAAKGIHHPQHEKWARGVAAELRAQTVVYLQKHAPNLPPLT